MRTICYFFACSMQSSGEATSKSPPVLLSRQPAAQGASEMKALSATSTTNQPMALTVPKV